MTPEEAALVLVAYMGLVVLVAAVGRGVRGVKEAVYLWTRDLKSWEEL